MVDDLREEIKTSLAEELRVHETSRVSAQEL